MSPIMPDSFSNYSSKTLKTPLKASVILLTAVILASCSSDGSDSNITNDSTPIIKPTPDNGGEGTGDEGSGNEGNGGEGNGTGGEVGGEDNNETAAEKVLKEAQKAKAEAEAKAKEAQARAKAAEDAKAKAEEASKAEIAAAEKAAKEAKDKADKAAADAKAAKDRAEAAEAKAKAEAAKASAAAQARAVAEAATKKAEKAKEDAIKAKNDAIKAKEEALQAQKEAEDALAAGGGSSSEALQAEADRKAKLAKEAQVRAESTAKAAQAAAAAAEARAAAATKAAKDSAAALAAAEIKNAPEAKKSGAQSLSIDAKPLKKVFETTTRDFDITDNGVEARADVASDGLLPVVKVTTSGENDKNLRNGFKSHEDNSEIKTNLGVLPLAYTSVYKDYDDDMRIGHIDGAAALGTTQLPVDGVAVVGNATQAANMPNEGQVNYSGDATYRQLGIGNDIEFGKSAFTADFVAKNLKGNLTFDKAGKIGLTAAINGNQFSGNASDNAGYNTEGGFFGGDAQYLGGIYEGNGAQGTYGAKSDKQTAAEQAAANAQAQAAAANKALKDAQAQAAASTAAANKAKEDAAKAQAAAAKAQEAADNAGNSEAVLKDAIARAAAAEEAEAKALKAAETAEVARVAALKAKTAAENAAKAAKDAADKAIGDAKAEADKKVAEANKQAVDAQAQAAAAEKEANDAKAAEAKAKAEANKAKTDAAEAVKAANAKADKANQQATAAQAQAALEKQKAADAQAEANQAKSELAKAQEDLAAAEKALENALANGGSTEALQAEVDRRQAALDAANAKASAAQQAQADAVAAAEAQVTAANQATQAAQDALTAAQIKNAPEAKKTGVQSINIDPSGAGVQVVFKTTTRDFEINEDGSVVDARADMASVTSPDQPGLLPAVPVTISGANDADAENGFKAHEDSTDIKTNLGVLPLTYTSTYKDFGDDMRIGHIDGAAALGDSQLPVNGVAVVGNATQAANMPNEGQVNYSGDATYRQLGIGNDIEFGQSAFTADFVAKNLTGNLTFSDKNIGLEASINGNQFSGSKDGYNADGGFFGGDAQYLGGVYEGKGAQGAYGAKSNKQTAAEQAAQDAQAQADAANKALTAVQAQAAAAQAAAVKAQADAVKAQEALQRAEDALENGGNGEDQLAAALERAAAAETAQAAAEAAAETAKAAEEAALLAQASAEDAAIKAQAAADKARGDADEQKAAKERAEVAQTAAEEAKEEALAAKAESDKAKDEALLAKTKAETARDEAVARAEAAEAEALEAANAFSAPDSRISGFQNTSVGREDGVFENNTNSYDKLKFYTNEVDNRISLKPVELNLRGANQGATDSIYKENLNGFKEYQGSTSFDGRLGSTIYNRNLDYSSVYKNFDNQMQIGHVNGTTKGTYREPISNVYVQGNATNLGDMSKLTNVNEGKAKYNGVASYIAGATGKIVVNGKSKFDADFVAKSLTGELTFTDKQVDIAADITNNTFTSKKDAAVSTVGGFYGKGAGLLGGVYEREDNSGYIKGTYGATKLDPTVEVVPDPTESKMTGFQSTSLSSIKQNVAGTQLENAIGYVEIRNDKSDFTKTELRDGSVVPVDNQLGDNFNSFNSGVVRGDMVKPESVLKPIAVSLVENGSVKVDAGKGDFINPTFNYKAVYKNFDSQMQVGHLYGNFNTIAGDVSRAANVYVEGYLTSQYGMDNLKTVNDGKAQYNGMATYIENIHLADNASTAPVNGRSAFDVDFVNGSVDGTLSFDAGSYKYMPEGNEIGIKASIDGNTFAGNVNGIDTAGGFYGEEGNFLGGIYQDASDQGGKGTVAGTGTKFQGTFGAEKVAK